MRIEKLLDLSGKVAVITGGAMGIGKGIAKCFCEAKANVLIADLDSEALKGATAEFNQMGLGITTFLSDVSKEDNVKSMIEKAVSTLGSVDILVNNAGIYPSVPVLKMSLAEFEKVISVNLKSVFLCTKYASDQMIKQGNGGRIINITSIDALHPSSVGLAHYDASKHGVWGFTKNVALELAPYKIWVNAIAPGGIATPGVKKTQKNIPAPDGIEIEKLLEAFLAKIPMKRMGEPDDIGKVALFLSSEMASYMTGSQIVVDGGYLLS